MKPLPKMHEAISRLLTERLKKHTGSDKNLNVLSCLEIYTEIFNTFVEVFTEAGVKLTNESMNYVAQQYYDGIEVTSRQGTHELDPNIFTVRARLENIETKELALMAVMLTKTDFAIPLIQEIKRRS